MNILSETSHNTEYISYCSLGVIFSLIFIAVMVAYIREFVSNRCAEVSGVVGFLSVTAFAAFFMFASYVIITDGARVTYKATITDFNVVYDQGYSIKNQDGEIYLLEKEK